MSDYASDHQYLPDDAAPDSNTIELRCDRHQEAYTARRLAYRNAWTRCPRCTAEAEERREAEERERQATEEVKRRARLLAGSGLKGRFTMTTLTAYEVTLPAQRPVLQACARFAVDATSVSGGGLMLIGPPGTGKTHLLAGIAISLIVDRGIRAHAVTVRDLVRELRATWRRDTAETEEQVIQRYGDAIDVLAIDEIGGGFGTEAEQAQLLDVIDRRYVLRRPTLIASNLPLPGIEEVIGERAFDRLREGAQVLPCTWPSRRGGGA